MAVIRRHWLMFSVQAVLLAALVGGLGFAFLGPAVVAQTERQQDLGTEPTLYSEVQQVRSALALTNSDLAAVGCTQAEAEDVLTQVKSWCEQNSQTLQAARSQVRSAKASLRQAMQQIHVGPADAQLISSVETLKQQVATAQSSQQAVYDQVAQLVAVKLSWDKQPTWQALRVNKDMPSRFRAAPGIDANQRKALEAHLRSRTANNDSTVILSAAQQSALETAQANRQARMNEVLIAEAKVLPRPIDPMLLNDAEETAAEIAAEQAK